MTPRLTRADATTIYSRIKALSDQGTSILNALQTLLDTEDVTELLIPRESTNPNIPFDTVMDIACFETSGALDPQVDHLAQELHRRIINSLGDIHITHYFITETIKRFNLTPAQAWLVTVARDMAYINARTGERREVVTFKRGYLEMAELIGSTRYKTIQAWLNLQWTSQQRGGNLSRFLHEMDMPDSNTYADLRNAQAEIARIELSLRNRLASAFENYSNARNQVDIFSQQILPDARSSLDLEPRDKTGVGMGGVVDSR
jgi:hypothetical protein